MRRPRLTLPAPAAELWRRIAPAVREEIATIGGGAPHYTIGGGSVLAARWGHRHSYAVDLIVDPKAALGMLAEGNNPASRFEAKMRALGGRPAFDSDLRLWRIPFEDGRRKLDLWATRPLLGAGEHVATIEERTERVLSSAQILRGKLERSQDHLARDVFDLAKAAEKEPDALEAAINAISRELADSIAQSFHWAGPAIANDAEEALSGVPAAERIEPRQLGNRGAQAISGALYAMCRIETRDGAIEVTTGTTAREKRTTRIEAGEAETDFEARGLTAYLEGRGPGAAALLDYARTACARYRERLLFEADAHGVTAWRTATAGMNLLVGNAADAHEERRTGAPAQRNRGGGHER